MRRHIRWIAAVAAAIALGTSAACAPVSTGADRFRSKEVALGTSPITVTPMDPTGSSGSFASLKSKAPTSGLPDRLMVYKVVSANVTRDEFQKKATKLGFTGKIIEGADRFGVMSSTANFSVEKYSGSFDYMKYSFGEQAFALKKVLSDAEYRRRAEEFLTSTGLMEEDAVFHDINRGDTVGTVENGKEIRAPYIIEARFGHKPLGGIPFDIGVGPKILVQFGEDGEILGAMSVWRHVKPYAPYALKKPAQAVDDVRTLKAQLFDVRPNDSGEVTSVALGYTNDPLGYDQKYVIPDYTIRGTTRSGQSFLGITHAIPDEMLKVDPSLVAND